MKGDALILWYEKREVDEKIYIETVFFNKKLCIKIKSVYFLSEMIKKGKIIGGSRIHCGH